MKTNVRRWLAMLLCLTMALSLLPAMAVSALAEEVTATDGADAQESGPALENEAETGEPAKEPDAGNNAPETGEPAEEPGAGNNEPETGEPAEEPGAGNNELETGEPAEEPNAGNNELETGEPAEEPDTGNNALETGEPAEEPDGNNALDADELDGGGDENIEPQSGTITPDGAVTDTWKQDELTAKGGAICDNSTGKLHLKTTSSHGNNAGQNVTPPAVFLNTTMNTILAQSEATEKTLSFDIEAVAASTGDNPLFGIMLNYKSEANANDASKGDIRGYYIGYDNYSKWYYQAYATGGGDWGGANSISSSAFSTTQPVHIEIKWTDNAVTSFKLDNTECLSENKDMSAVTTALGVIDSVGFKVGYYNSDNENVGDFYISNLHYTGQATIATYAVSGTVTDEDNNPLADVKVDAGNGSATTTDTQGEYTLDLPTGSYTLSFSKEGYTTKTLSVQVESADMPNQNVTLPVAHTVEIPTDGVDNGDWTQIEGTKVDGNVSPSVVEGKLVLTSGVTNGHKIQDVTPPPAMFMSSKLNTALANFSGETKTLTFTLTPETMHSAAGELPDLLTFGVVIDSNESNQGFMISYSNKEKWLVQNYGGSGYKVVGDLAAPTPGKPIDFVITWTRSTVTLTINGQEVNHGVTVNTLPKTDKIAFFTGGNYYETENGSLQDKQRTVVRISNLHYSGQEVVTAYKVAGTVEDDSNNPLEGATVSADNGRFTATTDSAGAYSMNLPEGTYTLKAEKDGYSTEEQSNFAVSSGSNYNDLENTNFMLSLLPTISGKVMDESGRPLRASVSSDKRPQGSAVACNEKGEFTIIGAVAGEHTLTAELEGYETTTKTVTVDDTNVTGVEIILPERAIPSFELQTTDMTVKVAQMFPQAIQYTMKNLTNSDGSPMVMYGQTAELKTIKINGKDINPTVTSEFDEANPTKVTYTMVIDDTNNNGTGVTATITAEIRVGLDGLNNQSSAAAGRTLGFYITGVEYAGADDAAKAANRLAHPVDTIEIPNHSLVSVRSTEPGAAVTGAKLAASTITSGDVTYPAAGNIASATGGYKEDFFAAFVYNDKLSASLASNSAYDAGGVAGDQCYPVRAQFEAKDGNTTVSIGLGSTLWYYDHDITRDEHYEDQKLGDKLTAKQKIIAPLETPFAKVVITGDMNGNDKVDWQDGAIAYRETVMHIPANSQNVADSVNLRISMNFGSMAANPFLIALDNVKRVAAHTDGLGQFVLLKGYAGEGHDSNHPQYDNIGVRMGGAEDMKTLITEGGELGATFGIHTNASEFYAEAIDDENQVRRYTNGSIRYGWNWLDQGIAINGVYDYASGLQKQRWDALYNIIDYELVKDHPFVVYVDVWGNYTSGTENDFMTRALSQNIISHNGWRIAHEWSGANPYESTFQHWVTDYTYGDYTHKGKLNSNVLRFLLNQYKDSFTPDFANFGGAANAPLLGGPAMQGFEGWQGDGEYDLSIYNTYNQMVYTKFLQHYPVTEWINADNAVAIPYGQGANSRGSVTSDWTPEMQLKLTDGTDEIVVTRGLDKTLDTTAVFDSANEVEYRSRVVTLNGRVIVEGAPASAGEDNSFPASKATLKYLIPWYWDNKGDRVTSANEKLYHWNAKGGASTWELPRGWENLSTVIYYELSDQGRGPAMTLNVSGGSITFPESTKANTGYVVVKGESNKGPQITYGTGLHLADPSFSIDIGNGPWTVAGNGSAVRVTNSEGISVLKMIGAVSVSQKLTGLTAGMPYVMYAAVDNRSNAKAVMTITDGEGNMVATNYTQRSIANNYISSYYLHNGHGMEAGASYFQNMFLYFTPEAGQEYTLTISREAGSGNVYFDDVRTVEYRVTTSPVTYDPDTGAATELHQDFENVPQGIWPFVVGPVEGVSDNRTHLSELNDPFSQAGWDVKKLDDVIDGSWSVKSNGLCGRNNLVYQTIPQNFRFEPNKVYTVGFDYELGSAGSYVAVVGDGAYSGLGNLTVYNLDQTLNTTVPGSSGVAGNTTAKAKVGHIEFTVVGSESGQTWVGIYSKDNADNQGTSGSAAAFGGYLDFVLDNLTIELAPAAKNELALLLREADTMVQDVYTEASAGDWAEFVAAREHGHTVFDNENATIEQIAAAVEELKTAMAKLTKADISISGTVKNANEAPVEGAVLTLEDAAYFPVGLTITTGADGMFQFVSKSGVELIPGTYHIKAEATGYYVTTTGDIVVTKTDGAKTQDIALEAEAPGAYVNDFNTGDISMMGHLDPPEGTDVAEDLWPMLEWVEYNGSGALKVTFRGNGESGGLLDCRNISNVVDKTVSFADGTVSFDVTPLTSGIRFGVTLRANVMNDRVCIGQQDAVGKWMGEFWKNTTGSDWTAVTQGKISVDAGATRNVRVVSKGQRFQVFIDGDSVYDITMDAVQTTPGFAGINMRFGSGREFIIDNIRIVRDDPAEGVYNISGAVNARSGVAVSGAAVELYDGEGNRVAGTTTNALGAYQISRVEPSNYTMKVSAPFFQGQEKSITVGDANLTSQDFTLVPDISTLTTLIAEVEELNEEDYTSESWAVLAEALTAAKAIDDSSTIAALNTAYRDLSNARDALVANEANPVDYSALRALYADVKDTQKGDYSAASWTAFQTALREAQAILSREATQAEINAARTALQSAYDGLEVSVTGVKVFKDGVEVDENTVLKVYTNNDHEGHAHNHSLTLTAQVEPETASNKNVNWLRETVDGKVALSRNGNELTITAIHNEAETNVGVVTLNIVAEADPNVRQTIKVQVIRMLENDVSISIHGVNDPNAAPKFGQTLEADINQLKMTDQGKAALSYQWKRTKDGVTTNIGQAVKGEAGKTYTLTAADIGATISVDVTADPATYYEGTRSATRSQPVEKADGPSIPGSTIHGVKTTTEANNDGKIVGFGADFAKYEYRGRTDANWSNVTGSEVTGLAAGLYRVRIKETATHKAGTAINVTVAAFDTDYRMISISADMANGTITRSESQADPGTTIILTIRPDAGYELDPLTLKVTGASGDTVGTEEGSDVTDTEDGKTYKTYTFILPDEDVTVSATFRKLHLTITHELTHLTCSKGSGSDRHEVEYGEIAAITLVPDEGYGLPAGEFIEITNADGVKITGWTISRDGTITITGGVTSNLTIKAAGVAKTYVVNYTLTNGLSAPEANAPRQVTHKAAYTGKLVAADGYALPESITVTMDGKAFTDFTYENGTLTIAEGKIAGNLVVTASGTAESKPCEHEAGAAVRENEVPATCTAGGSYDEVVYCTKCHKELSREAKTIAKLDHSLTHVEAKAATTEAEGNIEYWHCAACDKYFRDAQATQEITLADTVIDKLAPSKPSTPPTTTTVKKNPDGSTTTTVTDKKTGTVTETTEKPDGSKEVVETKKDGTVTETTEKPDGNKEIVETKPDGTVTETKTDPEGFESTKVTDPDKNVEIKVTDPSGEVLAEVKLPAEIPAPETRFEDVPKNHWADEAVHEMAGLGLVNGVGNGSFDMSSSMKRGDLALILSRLSNANADYELTFTDVPAGKYYANGVAWAAKSGVVTGRSADKFDPEATITRGELAVMLYRYAMLLKMDTSASASALDAFKDGSATPDWAVDSLAWCVENGILQGKGGGILDSTATSTRAEVAVMLQRFVNLMK